jgi:short-subunit dehydrogenase
MVKSVLVTGANSGIGLATALELARGGFDVYGTARSEEKAETIRSAAGDEGVQVTPLVWNAADAEESQRGMDELRERLGDVPWALVNNAGYARTGAIEDVDDEQARDQLEVNVVAPIRLARMVLPRMRERGDGRIVTMSSLLGRVSVPFLGWYAASKHALEAATDALRIETADSGVHVVLVEPGVVGTKVFDEAADLVPDGDVSVHPQASERVSTLLEQGQHSVDPIWIARVVRLALVMPHPLARYLATPDALAAVAADKLVPTVVKDYVWQMVSGLRAG